MECVYVFHDFSDFCQDICLLVARQWEEKGAYLHMQRLLQSAGNTVGLYCIAESQVVSAELMIVR